MTACNADSTFPRDNPKPPKVSRPEKKARLIQAMLEYPGDVAKAGRMAGYSNSYVNCGKFYQFVKKIKNSDEFQKAVRDYIQGTDLLDKVLRVSKIDSQVLTLIENDPERYPRLAAVPKQIKQQAGILAPDVVPQETANITIKQMQVMIASDFDVARRCITPDKNTSDKQVLEMIDNPE